jgi:hypothetical protein
MTQPIEEPPPVGPGIVARQPVRVFLGGLAGVVSLGLIAANALDWIDLDNNQTAAIVATIAGACALVSETLRAKVYSPATVATLTAPEEGMP